MKRQSGLFPQICDRQTLAVAAARAALGKRHRAEVRNFFAEYNERISEIGTSLRSGTFAFSKYRQFPVRDPKSRIIHAPAFQDRVVHHAIVHVVGPIFEMGAIEHSFACRRGKGQHAALNRASQWIHAGDWFFKADIRKFYDSVDHDVLRLLLRRRFREERLLELFDRLLASYSHEPGKGLPIGALTSQHLGNFYLDPVDSWAKQTLSVRRYLRYMDDMLFIGTRSAMQEAQHQMGQFLESFGLSVKGQGQLNRCDLGVPYLGFTVYANRIRLNSQGRKRVRQRTRQFERSFEKGLISESELQQRVGSMFAHAKYSDDIRWRRTLCQNTLQEGSQEPGVAWRVVQEHGQQVPLGVSQQEQGR